MVLFARVKFQKKILIYTDRPKFQTFLSLNEFSYWEKSTNITHFIYLNRGKRFLYFRCWMYFHMYVCKRVLVLKFKVAWWIFCTFLWIASYDVDFHQHYQMFFFVASNRVLVTFLPAESGNHGMLGRKSVLFAWYRNQLFWKR